MYNLEIIIQKKEYWIQPHTMKRIFQLFPTVFFFFWGNVNNKFYFIFLIPLGIDFSLHAITISSDKTLLSSPTCDRWRQGRDNMIIYKS